MENKELIIALIQQDLKHSQLLYGLQNIGLGDTEVHQLELCTIISRLMSVPDGDLSDRWQAAYINFMMLATRYEITPAVDALQSLAHACYTQLTFILDDEFGVFA